MTSNLSPQRKASQRASEQRRRKKRKAEKRVTALKAAFASKPDHIKVVRQDSNTWKKLVEADPSYKKANGIVSAYVRENKNTISYKFYEEKDDNQLRDEFLSLITDPRMLPIERKQAEKFGSFWQPSFGTWAHKVWELYKHTSWDPDEEILKQAVESVTAKLQLACVDKHNTRTLQPLPLNEAWNKVTKGKNSGYPYYSKSWAKDSESLQYYLEQATALLEGKDVLANKPFVLFKRIQNNGDTPKVRPIQGAPKEDSIAAKCFADPLVDLFKTIPQFCGFNGGERVASYAKDTLEQFENWLSADFSAFDANAQHLVRYAFEVLKGLFPEEHHTYLNNTLKAYQNVKLITPIGLIYSDKINGVASGCGFTSILGTISNAICTEYFMRRSGIQEHFVLSYGDDIVIATHKEIDLEKFESIMAEVGMETNPVKQEQSRDYFSFLGYIHFRGQEGEGVFPIMRLAPGFRHRERYFELGDMPKDVNPDQMLALAIASRLNVARNHKDFSALVEYVRHGTTKLTYENLEPMMKYRDILRVHRTSRGTDFPVMRELFGHIESKEVPNDEEFTNPADLAPEAEHEELLEFLLG